MAEKDSPTGPDTQRAMPPGASPAAPLITSSVPGSFPWSVFHRRHPELLRRVRESLPYGPRQRRALDALEVEVAHGVVEPLDEAAPDRDTWDGWGREHFGRSWFEAPFLWAESYFYRRLLGAVDYFTEGPWWGVDPFAPMKQAELRGSVVDAECAALAEVAALPADQQSAALLGAALRGNRADLSFRIASPDGSAQPSVASQPDRTHTAGSELVVDESAALWALLDGAPAGTVHLVADNAGPEVVPDLILLDHLLTTGRAAQAVLHVKPHPYYVSDATTEDTLAALHRLVAAPGPAGQAGRRLWAALREGRLELRAHPFFCAPFPYTSLPPELRAEFAGAALTLFKGDLNYRRLVGDRHWPATTAFAECTAYFPGPVAALRLLKSNVMVGLGSPALAALEASGQQWRTSGTHALIQCRTAPTP